MKKLVCVTSVTTRQYLAEMEVNEETNDLILDPDGCVKIYDPMLFGEMAVQKQSQVSPNQQPEIEYLPGFKPLFFSFPVPYIKVMVAEHFVLDQQQDNMLRPIYENFKTRINAAKAGLVVAGPGTVPNSKANPFAR